MNKHLKDHANKMRGELLKWHDSYIVITQRKHKYFDNSTLTLVKYFISSNASLVTLCNPHMLSLMKIDIPCEHTFIRTILPEIFANLEKGLESKLQDATCISLISDIWTTKGLIDFLAICISTSDLNFKREIIVLGMIQMPGRHAAENVKAAIEDLINKFEFDKSKCGATVSDQGSCYVRLFKQLQNSSAANSNIGNFHEIDFDPVIDEDDNVDDEHEDNLMCFDDQIENPLVNYDYADNDIIDPLDNCEVNSKLSNVNLEIIEAWGDALEVPIESNIRVAPAAVILTDDVLFQLELEEFDDEYEPSRNLGAPLKKFSIMLG